MTIDSVSTARRNPGIDALRGVSILFVILNHIGIRVPLAKTVLASLLPIAFLKSLNYNGYESVFIFFVISGFLITQRSLQRWGSLSAIRLPEFYVLRGARILPCLLAIVAVLSLLHLLRVPNFVIDHSRQSLAGAIASALGLYLNWYEGMTGWLPGGWDVLWSLSIEEVFYLAFPLACLALGRHPKLFAAALLTLALSVPYTRGAIVGNEIWQEKAYLPGMSAIAAGVLAALLAQRIAVPRRWIAALLSALGVLGIGSVFFAGKSVWSLLHQGYMLLLIGSACTAVLGANWLAASAPRPGLRGLGWLRACGRLSYEIYLCHMFWVFGVLAIANASGLDARWGVVWYPPIIVLSWLLGWLVARGFSEPCERALRRRFANRPASTPVSASSATAS